MNEGKRLALRVAGRHCEPAHRDPVAELAGQAGGAMAGLVDGVDLPAIAGLHEQAGGRQVQQRLTGDLIEDADGALVAVFIDEPRQAA